ncbi:MAG: MFS transporter [Chloroflexi bacterium]|nr:MFS transporter [Chloroflexota bacterium]
MILLMVWASFLLSFIDRLLWGSVAVPARHSLNLPVAALGSFDTAFYIGYVVSNALCGFATDRLGGRIILTAVLFLLGLFTFLFSFTNAIIVGLIFQILMGLAAGADYAACVKLVLSWFPLRDRGKAMGLFMTASSLGVTITNAIVPSLLKTFRWGTVYQIIGFVTIVAGIICFLLLHDGPILAQNESKQTPNLAQLLRNRDLIFLALAGFGALWGTWGYAVWANALMVTHYHVSLVQAGFIVALFGIGAIISKPLIGWLSDWLGGARKVPIIIILASFVVMLLIFGSLSSVTAFEIAAPFLGITAFVYSPLMNTMVPEVAGRTAISSSAGITNAFWQLGSVIVPLVVGVVFQSTHSFYAAFVALAAGPLLGALCMLFVRERKVF